MIVDKTKDFIRSWDMFSNSNLMRYNNDTSRSTFTGAAISLAIYGFILYLIVSATLGAVKRT